MCVCVYSNAVDVWTPLPSSVFVCMCVYVVVCMNAFVESVCMCLCVCVCECDDMTSVGMF